MGDIIELKNFKTIEGETSNEYAEVTFYNEQDEVINTLYYRTEKEAIEALLANDYIHKEGTKRYLAIDKPEIGKVNQYAVVRWIAEDEEK